MRAKLKSMSSSDLPDLREWMPEDPENFGFELQFFVGSLESEGADMFSVKVCTPQWLMENHRKTDVMSGRLRIIMFEYSYDRLRGFLENYVDGLEEETWTEIANRMGRISYWEFEDMDRGRRKES